MPGLEKEYELKVYLTQEEDCCQPSGEGFQELKIEHHDGGGGVFYTISTPRWAFETPEELMEQINEFVDKVKKLNNDNGSNKE